MYIKNKSVAKCSICGFFVILHLGSFSTTSNSTVKLWDFLTTDMSKGVRYQHVYIYSGII